MRILFVCDFPRPFTGRDFHGAGVGGTEAAVVVLAEELARSGHGVVVGTPGPEAEAYGGVAYAPLSAAVAEPFDLAVLVKGWSSAAPAVRAGRRVFFFTDVHTPDPAAVARACGWADEVLLMSDFQRERLLAAIPSLAARPLRVVGLPVHLPDYTGYAERRENVLLYCSVPDRGLHHLARIFPRVRRSVPDARLVVTSDFTLWGHPSARPAYEALFRGVEGVTYLGRVDRAELVAWQGRAKVMAYPCSFPEGFCIAAAECMAAGAVPVATRAFALPGTVGAGGVLLGGRPSGWLFRHRFARAVVRLLRDAEEWARRSAEVRADAFRRFAPARLAGDLLAAAAP